MKQKTIEANTLRTPAMERAIAAWGRAFYGADIPAGGHPTGLAAALTGYLATLATSELDIRLSGGVRADYLKKQLEPVRAELTRAVQLAAAFGCCILRPKTEGGRILVEVIPGDRFYPTRLDGAGRPMAGFFADFRNLEGQELVRLESFDCQGGVLRLENRAYRLRNGELGQEIPLDSHPAWRELSKSVTVEQAKGPLFGYLAMPFANVVDAGSALPVSLYAGAEESLREFDRLWGEFLYELHSGKRKRIVERQALPGLSGKPVPGAPGYQDLAADTYLVLDPMEQQKPFDDYSPVLRTAEYQTGLQALLRLIESRCRLSPGAVSLETGAVWPGNTRPATAAEVVSRDRTTYHTCLAVQEQGLRPALCELLTAMDALCDLYGLCPAGAVAWDISFGDSVFEDTGTEFERRLRLAQAGYLRPEKLLGWYFHAEAGEAEKLLPQ